MSAPAPDPSLVGRALPPPPARLPDPASLFLRRAERWEVLAADHPLGAYLAFLAGIARIQHAIATHLPALEPPDRELLARAAEHAMPPLPRQNPAPDPALDATLDAFLDEAAHLDMPAEAAAALDSMRHGSPDMLRQAIVNVLDDAIPVENLAGHAFVAAALQVHYARRAAMLDVGTLAPVATGICPACGGPPVSSLVVGWPGAENARYCVCSLCATYWNAVRVKCTVCESTSGIGFRSVDGADGSIKAECCDACNSYLKVLYQVRFPRLDPVADDVASLDLDVLLRDTPYRRAGYNPFLLGG
jgi:FdhE protein